jgi:serine/threonine protein phosphatase PrpC
MTRSMGDLVAKSVGVTYEPEIKAVSNLTSQDKFLVIASDGLWDRIPNDEVCRIVANPFYDRGDAEGAVQFLAKESAERWTREQGMIDDITIVIAFINPQTGSLQTASHNGSNAYGNGLTSATTATNIRTDSRATSII